MASTSYWSSLYDSYVLFYRFTRPTKGIVSRRRIFIFRMVKETSRVSPKPLNFFSGSDLQCTEQFTIYLILLEDDSKRDIYDHARLSVWICWLLNHARDHAFPREKPLRIKRLPTRDCLYQNKNPMESITNMWTYGVVQWCQCSFLLERWKWSRVFL